MIDHVEQCLRMGFGSTVVPNRVKALDVALFPPQLNREALLRRYMVLLRHPEFYDYLRLADGRFTPITPENKVSPSEDNAIPASVMMSLQSVFRVGPQVVFQHSKYDLSDLTFLWNTSRESVLRLGAAVLGLAYVIDYYRVS